MSLSWTWAYLLALLLCSPLIRASTTSDSSDYSCSATSPCKVGCCSKSGVCGLGPTFCGAGNCTSSCDQKSECDPGWGSQWSSADHCPLNVCCSKYGFCGTTSEFCGIETVQAPTSSANVTGERSIGYYEGWSPTRRCGGMYPEDLPISDYTHLNYAFALIDPHKFTVAPMSDADPDLMHRLTDLKSVHTELKTWISIGGWSMNDADQPTAKTFSTLAGSESAQQSFFKSLLQFMATFGFDGVDIDWEYPVAPERSGRPEDYKNYVSFLRNLRSAFAAAGRNYGISITLPSSYWYMKNFDIVSIEPLVDWFNVMTYDLHGTWDANDAFIGAYVYAHTNLTEIRQTMDLMWRNKINPAKITMGLGFYGRSFTLTDPKCTSPGCEFSAGGKPGPCTQSAGTLSYDEIQYVIEANNVIPVLDEAAAVKQIVWDSDQWVSYDDQETLKLKLDYANHVGIGGTMVWAASLDSDIGLAANSLSNVNGRTEKLLSETSNTALPLQLSQCIWGECAPMDQLTCPYGTSPAQKTRHPGGGNMGIATGCPKGQQRPFCCPQDNVPTCQWVGTAPWCAHASCSGSQVSIASSRSGSGHTCSTNHKNLCCELTPSDVDWDMCSWTGSAPQCTGSKTQAVRNHVDITSYAECPSNTIRIGGDLTGAGGEEACAVGTGYKSLCCSKPAPWKNCAWHDSGETYFKWPPEKLYSWGTEGTATIDRPVGHKCDNSCPSGKVPIAADNSGCYSDTSAYFCCDTPTDDSNSIPAQDTNLCELPDGFINAVGTPFANVPPDADPSLESPVGDDDCYIPGIPNSGWIPNSGSPPPHDEFRRSILGRSSFSMNGSNAIHDEYRQACVDDPDCAELHYNTLEERDGNTRLFSTCKNPPGSTRTLIKAEWYSLAYPPKSKLVIRGVKVFWVSAKACNIGTALQVASAIPKQVQAVVEHVIELVSIARIFNSMTDGFGPGGIKMKKLAWDVWEKVWYSAADPKYWPAAAGQVWNQVFMGILGSSEAIQNLLLLDTGTNNMKALIWGGAVNIISTDRWKASNHLERMGLLKYVEGTFAYLNAGDTQKALSGTYEELLKAADGLAAQMVSSTGVTYDVREGVYLWMGAQLTWMSTKTVAFFKTGNGKKFLDDEIKYFASAKAKLDFGPADAATYKLYLSQFQKGLSSITKIKRGWVQP